MSGRQMFQAKEAASAKKSTSSLLRPAAAHPAAEQQAAFPPINSGRDFSAIPFKPVHPAPALGPSSISCPFTPERCPFGGACHACPPKMQMQAKLKIGQPGDRYEQEADRVAEQVMRMPEPQVQRKCSAPGCKDEEEDKLVQTKSAGSAGNAQVDHPLIQSVLSSPGQPLDAGARSFMEPRFGQDFSGVRVHVGGQAAESARAVNARAYTVGRDVVFGEGQYAPGSDEGQRLVAHELVHVGQQRTGIELSHGLGRIKDRYERHANTVTDRVVHGQATERLFSEVADSAGGARKDGNLAFVQRQIVSDSSTKTLATSNPKALIPLAQFIQYVEAVEKAYSSDTPTDIITRIRVQYYSGIAFESLIPDAHYEDTYWVLHPDITFSVSRTMDKDKIDKVDPDAYEHLTAHADENKIGDNPSPYVVMPNGDRVDVGHLLLGLDALIHPRAGDPYATLGVPNIDPASWVADIGIAAVWMTQHEEVGSPPSDAPRKLSSPDLNAYYQMSAPKEDLFSDVDSFGLHVQFASTANQTLSQALRSYYIGSATQSAGAKQHWQTFCSKNGLGYARSGSSITWNAGTRVAVIKRVDTFNDLYGAGKSGSIWNMLKKKSGFTIAHRSWPHTPAVVDKFLDWVKTNLEAELSTGGAKP